MANFRRGTLGTRDRHWGTFADAFGITGHIRSRSRVSAVEPVDGGPGNRWTVQTEDGAEERFDVVVVGSGHQGRPAHPEWAGEFAGEYRHSHAYREPMPFRGKRVLVVGVGNSGLDIAADLVPFAAQTTSSARSPVLIMPRMILGVPSSRVLAKIGKPWLPWIVQRQLMRWISRLYHCLRRPCRPDPGFRPRAGSFIVEDARQPCRVDDGTCGAG